MYSRLDSPTIAWLAAGMAVLMVGCNRTEAVSAAASTPVANTATWNAKIEDAIVTWKVQSALQEARDLKALDITFETRKSIVMLGGVVDHQTQADRVILLVSNVAGVKGVENKIISKDGIVVASNIAGSDMIAAKVNALLRSDPAIKGVNIVAVNNQGEVKLGGLVDSQTQIEHAVKLIRRVEGVQDVVSDVRIKK